MAFDLSQHMQEQKIQNVNKFAAIMDMAVQIFMAKVDPSKSKDEIKEMAKGSFHAADAIFAEIETQKEARL